MSSLTYPDKDIFKALEGVGQKVAQLTSDVYQHGLLKKSLPQALLWAADNLYCRPSPPQRAPSWHWASYEGHQTFQSTRDLDRNNRQPGLSYTPSLAYLFMSDECQVFASDLITDLWPSLLCIGRLISSGDKQPYLEEFFLSQEGDGRLYDSVSVRNESNQVQEVISFRKDSARQQSSFSGGLSYLPLVGLQKAPRANLKASPEQQSMGLSTHGLILQQREDETFQRMGVFHRHSVSFVQRMQATRPRLIELA